MGYFFIIFNDYEETETESSKYLERFLISVSL